MITEKIEIRQENNKLVPKIVFVARCNIHLDICPKILSLKWSRFGLITVESSRALFFCYAAVIPIPVQSFQESTRRRFEKRRVEISLSIDSSKLNLAKTGWKNIFNLQTKD